MELDETGENERLRPLDTLAGNRFGNRMEPRHIFLCPPTLSMRTRTEYMKLQCCMHLGTGRMTRSRHSPLRRMMLAHLRVINECDNYCQ